MGEDTKEVLELQFDKWLGLEFEGAGSTSDAGLLACRELDGAPALTGAAPTYLRETRGGWRQRPVVPRKVSESPVPAASPHQAGRRSAIVPGGLGLC